MSIFDDLKLINPPSLDKREKMALLLQQNVFGYMPQVDFKWSVSEPTDIYGLFALGNVTHSFVTMTVSVGDKSHSFRIDRLLHNDGKKRPLIVFNNFHPLGESRYFPLEEMTESEVDFLSIYYKDVTDDNGDFDSGIAPLLLPNGRVSDTDCGKIMMWAWANMRVLDYGLTLPGTDAENVGVAGHSRLGKTALVTGMLDTRFKFVFTNAAGCSGDALAKAITLFNESGKQTGELISDIYRVFPFWFAKRYALLTEKNYSDDFDMNFLVASVAPRYVLVGCCSEDHWACPKAQQLCALSASSAWEEQGLDGLLLNDYLPVGAASLDGHVGIFHFHSYHRLSRHCWNFFIDFIEKHKND